MQTDSVILALARHVLGFIGTWLVSQGYLGEAATEQFIGSMLVLVALVWSVANKFKTGKVIQAALDSPTGTSRVELGREVAKAEQKKTS